MSKNKKAEPVDKRRVILDAAITVFAREGFHRCRVSDIAREANVAYGLVYHYFRSKDQILNTIFTERWSLLHPSQSRRKSYLETSLEGRAGPVVAATDYMRGFADQVRSQVPRRYVVLGTDGFGRSDYRVKLRKFFEVNRYYVAVAALKALADDGEIKPEVVEQAIKKYGLDTERPDPWAV